MGLEMIEADGTLTNLDLVPLCAALLEAQFVRHLRLEGQPLQDTGAAVLAMAIPGCPWIEELDLVSCKFTGRGAKAIADALPNSKVRRLVLRANKFRVNAVMGEVSLAEAIAVAEHLELVDLQSCGVSSAGMRRIKSALSQRAKHGLHVCHVDFEGNFVLVQVLSAVTHGACILICLEAWRELNRLIVQLCHVDSRLSLTVYIFSMLMMFSGSTLYHSMFAVIQLSWFFKLLDHCAIYFLIAGTYTPILMLGCRHEETLEIAFSTKLWVFIYWFVVLLGVIMEHMFGAHAPNWFSKFLICMYVLMGFGGVPYISYCSIVQDAHIMPWIDAGGIVYIVGVVFFLLDKRFPAMHVLWHICVSAGSALHFVAVWRLTWYVLSLPNQVCDPKKSTSLF
eukprot:gnl/TRDRNA2_/TRDRNA2_203613_c0_seq1.p1 gnl/TRDRNA2_/TRDRNA2_203613_c0~~gnl/TRDRNA2_/TRDRNA2_203613_c0_seq1.p1  ORF type:complete len:431 (+),score=38.97 gnl/TRDRNA2_/TRDRNA2_203613_c0_seq1:114-1295(+)